MTAAAIPIQPVRPIAPYIGGKRALAGRLVNLIDGIDHHLYAEPFVGMGGVFFRRCRKPAVEVINDVSGDVTTLFRILQRHYQPFLDTIKWQLSSRTEFDRLMRTDPLTLTDLERAARFLYLQKTAFGGKVAGRHFGVDRHQGSRFNLTSLEPLLEAVHDRLAGVTIERLQWADFVQRYDRPETFFYLDPPYFGCENDYGPGVFSRDEFTALADVLERIQGRFILSINDRPETRETFGRFKFVEVDLTYSIGIRPTAARELIISGGGDSVLRGT